MIFSRHWDGHLKHMHKALKISVERWVTDCKTDREQALSKELWLLSDSNEWHSLFIRDEINYRSKGKDSLKVTSEKTKIDFLAFSPTFFFFSGAGDLAQILMHPDKHSTRKLHSQP